MTIESFIVDGMSCGHCAASVTREVSAVAGVTDVAVDLQSRIVSVTAAQPIAESAVAAAVAEAGYTLAGRPS
ncbi:heavy-metal-associated domain-containing protein [Microbacterium rhizosphaerae]|uniref:Heavy-metal-associated domain-containing protein n=1 Tax=Microbacterium rhizosphaerae TaxID=1678237 RepID=A0ABZ0SJJ2_9MICO|nr:heavy-metal-associated domain-containing protein [Microbacterium rhizosphaerae]WPR88783.1 heavy-metal-associated domain-containing protein [Microbacterium rhizosphaerae]